MIEFVVVFVSLMSLYLFGRVIYKHGLMGTFRLLGGLMAASWMLLAHGRPALPQLERGAEKCSCGVLRVKHPPEMLARHEKAEELDRLFEKRGHKSKCHGWRDDMVEVRSVEDELVAYYCVACDSQISLDEVKRARRRADPRTQTARVLPPPVEGFSSAEEYNTWWLNGGSEWWRHEPDYELRTYITPNGRIDSAWVNKHTMKRL